MLEIPTESDWRSEPWCLDAEHAYKKLAGKSRKETVELFHENSLAYQEDIMFMPFACFPFYANAYIDYLRSDLAKDDSDGASCFFGLIDVRIQDISKTENGFPESVIETLKHLGENQNWYDAEESIYGSFSECGNKLIDKLQEIIAGNKTRAHDS